VPNRTRIGETLYVSAPFRSVLGNYVVVVGRVLHGPHGAFEGMVVAALDARYFEVVMRSVMYAKDMRATLAHADGKVFVGLPRADAPDDIHALVPPYSADRAEVRAEAAGSIEGATAHGANLVALREVAPAALQMDRPLVVAVSRSLPAVFGPWRHHAFELGGFFAVLLLATTLGLRSSQWRRQEFDRLAAAASDERRVGAERLELALRGAQLGLWDWHVPDDRFLHNELTRLQLGYEPDEIGLDGTAWRSLFHPDDAARVLATIEAHFARRTEAYECEFRVRHKDGHSVWLLSRGKVVERDAKGEPLRMAGTHMDITERKRIELELQHLNQRLTQLSTTDGLTEVGNRRLFDQTLSAEWARAARKRDPVALLMIDIDHFKDYNDAYGHPAGDECLRKVARLISETVKREGELVARYGGEEFALLLPGADAAAARAVAERCLDALAEVRIEHRASPTSAWLTMSIGIAAAVAAPGTLPAGLVEAADAALYRAKRAGRSRFET
jgi:diguanylate cyclase (GGDEF)-like protein/PAS domain S-box-containing protein